jgi:hypothetical protein
LTLPLFQNRKEAIDILQVFSDFFFVFAEEGVHLQVLGHREFYEELSSLRTVDDAFADDLMGGDDGRSGPGLFEVYLFWYTGLDNHMQSLLSRIFLVSIDTSPFLR